jgi:hypothetical protein
MPKKTMRVWVTRDAAGSRYPCVWIFAPVFDDETGTWWSASIDGLIAMLYEEFEKLRLVPDPGPGGPSSIIECEIPIPCFRVVKGGKKK